MKSNRSMLDLAQVMAMRKGPRMLSLNGKRIAAMYLTKKEIYDLHAREGFTSEKTIERRIDKWLVMDKNEDDLNVHLAAVVADYYWIFKAESSFEKEFLTDFAQRNMCEEIIGAE